MGDVDAAFVADPFAIRFGTTWFLFFEVLNRRSGKGEIAVATSGDLRRWEYKGVVLSEALHLSYPHVFEWQGDVYMTPECWESGAVPLYKARDFPTDWELIARLIERPVLLDPSPFVVGNDWWMFVESDRGHRYGTLRLYHATQLAGPWREHSASPIVSSDPAIARPAGRVVASDGQLFRLAQDCSALYGAASLSSFEIQTLDADSYLERSLGRIDLASLGVDPETSAVHHIDMHNAGNEGWVSFFDVSAISEPSASDHLSKRLES